MRSIIGGSCALLLAFVCDVRADMSDLAVCESDLCMGPPQADLAPSIGDLCMGPPGNDLAYCASDLGCGGDAGADLAAPVVSCACGSAMGATCVPNPPCQSDADCCPGEGYHCSLGACQHVPADDFGPGTVDASRPSGGANGSGCNCAVATGARAPVPLAAIAGALALALAARRRRRSI